MKFNIEGRTLQKTKKMNNFNLMLTSHYNELKPFALRFTKCEERACDLMQETMLLALRHREKFQQGTNVKAWLYTIMRNFFINQYRRINRRGEVSVSPDVIFSGKLSERIKTASDVTGMKELQKNVEAVPDVFKIPFLLFTEGYHYNEISAMLKQPLGTIKSRIHFARKLLKEKLSKSGYERVLNWRQQMTGL
jgi:RNA polymerase sigma factor (sigma-70 family)